MSNVTVNRGSTDKNSYDSHGFKHVGQSERLVSMVAGTSLASNAMRSRSLMSAAILLGISAGLIHRGATGRCGFSKGISMVNDMLNKGCNQVNNKIGNSSKNDEVNEASDESFPASDAPSFTPVTGEGSQQTHMNK